MKEAAANLEFEEAARLRDELRRLEMRELEVPGSPAAAMRAAPAGSRPAKSFSPREALPAPSPAQKKARARRARR
jgi:excinuclease ABC subunit B